MAEQRGDFIFPGVDAILEGSGTHVTGSRPTVFRITTTPLHAPTKQIGDLNLKFGNQDIRFKDCAVVEGSYQFNKSGQVIGMLIEDRRWKWAYSILDGHYNVKGSDGKVIESTRKTLRELFEIVFKEIEESKFDVSEVTQEEFPEVKWVAANGAEELSRLESMANCRLVLHLNNRVKLWPIGKGKQLPDDHLIEGGDTLTARAVPSSVMFVGGRTLYQRPLQLRAVGLDIDDKVKPIDKVKYTPLLANGTKSWKDEVPGEYLNLVPFEQQQTESGLKIIDYATRSIFRWYEIVIPKEGLTIPSRDKPVRDPREFLEILSTLSGNAEIMEDIGKPRKSELPAKIMGNYFNDNPFAENDPNPARVVDHNSNVAGIYKGSFRINSDGLRVEFDQPVVRIVGKPGEDDFGYAPAVLWLFTAFTLQTVEGKEDRIRIEKKIPGPAGPANKTGPHVVNDDDVILSLDAGFDTSFDKQQKILIVRPKKRVITNRPIVEKEADIVIKAELRKFERTPGQDKLYSGFRPIELDGAILQVQWSRASNGVATTRASRNSEFPTPIPNEDQRKKIMRRERALREFDRREGVDRRDRKRDQRVS